MRKMTGIDIAMIVTGVMMLILTISLFGVSGALFNSAWLQGIASSIQLGVAGWYLITSVLAIASGASGHKCPYIAVIVMTVLSILISLAAGIIAACMTYLGLFEPEVFGGLVATTQYPDFGSVHIDGKVSMNNGISINAGIEKDGLNWATLSVGIMVINFISFVLLIVISSLACCGTCCSPRTPVPGHTTIVTTTGGYVAAPPGYVVQPPGQPGHQQHNFQGMSNPQYDTALQMDSYKS